MSVASPLPSHNKRRSLGSSAKSTSGSRKKSVNRSRSDSEGEIMKDEDYTVANTFKSVDDTVGEDEEPDDICADENEQSDVNEDEIDACFQSNLSTSNGLPDGNQFLGGEKRTMSRVVDIEHEDVHPPSSKRLHLEEESSKVDYDPL